MATAELTIKRREGTGKEIAKRLRRAGAVPAILYGGTKTETVSLDPKAVLRMIHGHEGTTQLLTLTFEGETGNGARLAIIRELQFDPVSDALLHVDLQRIAMDENPQIVLFHPMTHWGQRDNVFGFSVAQTSMYRLWDAWKTQ